MKALVPLAFVLGGCSQILGLTEPTQEQDAGPIPDMPPDGPLPGTVRVTTGGTSFDPGVITSVPAGIDCPGTCEFTFPVGTEVTLSATTTSDTFTGFFQGGCTGGQTCTITPVGTVDVFARYFSPRNIWFVSSTVQKPGEFDSVADADAHCDQLAAAAGLIERNYIAWLSTSTASAFQRLQAESLGQPGNGWVRPDGKLFLGSQTELQAGKVKFPPRLDEFGRDVGDDAIVATDSNGAGSPGTGTHCQDWASVGAAPVLAGEAAGGTNRWSTNGTTACNADSHLYCFAAIANDLFANPPTGASVVFVSEGTGDGATSVAAFDVICENERNTAGLAGTAMALVTPGGGKTVKQRFEDDGISFTSEVVMRPDGTEIAPNMAALLDGLAFPAAPNVTADRDFLDVDVWIGGGGFADFQTDCSGWTSTSGFGASRPAATTRGTSFFVNSACNQQRHILCFAGVIAQSKPKRPAGTAPTRR